MKRYIPVLIGSCFVGLISGCVSQAVVQSPPAAGSVEAPAFNMFDASVEELRRDIDLKIKDGVDVPQPVDAGGGYSHEQHKKNGRTIYDAGMLYKITGDTRYRDFAASVLLDYAHLYPTLGIHPEARGSSPGRLFWQGLNEAVWLVYAIQGYEQVRPDLDAALRTEIESGVLRPLASFISEGSPQTFNLIHNHATWAAAAVGMTGYVLGDERLVEQSLMGLDRSGESGFLRQLDLLFSPDGYYAEGPYYQRYALMPFVLFAQAIETNEPDRKIFEYRDGIVLKAIRTTIQQTYSGRFFPLNDAIREKGLNTAEVKYALAIAYDLTGDPTFLDIASRQDSVVPTEQGRKLAEGIAAGLARPFPFQSMLLRDGPAGTSGGLAILRSGPRQDDAAIVFKAASQGMGHGHLDRLALSYFDNGDEVVADYGAARFLNVESKDGGRYLPENTSWAQQTVAHNTLVVDQTSQFGGDWKVGEYHPAKILAFGSEDGIQYSAAEIGTAYEGVTLQRFVALVPGENRLPFAIDIFRAHSAAEHTYDLPVHFKGQLIEASFPFVHAQTSMVPLGNADGYQHLWKRAEAKSVDGLSSVSWLLEDQFYTLTFKASAGVTAFLAELGANDPNDNLRQERALILRAREKSADFVSVYERGGRYDNDQEVTVFDGSSVVDITTEKQSGVTLYSIRTRTDGIVSVFFADDAALESGHSAQLNGTTIEWTGPVHVMR